MTNIAILGAGGHAKVLIDVLQLLNTVKIVGIFDTNREQIGRQIAEMTVRDEADLLAHYAPTTVQLVNGVGSVGDARVRTAIFQRFKQAGYTFFNVIHPRAYVSATSRLGEGVQVMSGCTLQPDCQIGDNVIVNTHTVVEHDCHIDAHVHLAPGVICCGSVTIGRGTHVGSGATLLQGVTIGEQCLIAAGAVVVRDVLTGLRVAGLPAKEMGSSS